MPGQPVPPDTLAALIVTISATVCAFRLLRRALHGLVDDLIADEDARAADAHAAYLAACASGGVEPYAAAIGVEHRLAMGVDPCPDLSVLDPTALPTAPSWEPR